MRRVEALKYLTRHNIPKGFMPIFIKAATHGGLEFSAPLRELELLVVVVENTSESHIDVGDFQYRKIMEFNLRETKKTDAILNDVKSESKKLFPPSVLEPKEKIVIPLRMQFTGRKPYVLEAAEQINDTGKIVKNMTEFKESIQKSVTIHIDGIAVPKATQIAKDIDSFKKPELPSYPERFDFGPSLQVDSVEVNGTYENIRNRQPDNFLIYAGWEKGSCPIVYTYQQEERFWYNEGEVLRDAVGKVNKSKDAIVLKNFFGIVRISEKDDEIFVMDKVKLNVLTADQRRLVFSPNDVTLAKTDNEVRRFEPGDEYIWDLRNSLSNIDVQEAELEVVGYYRPFSMFFRSVSE